MIKKTSKLQLYLHLSLDQSIEEVRELAAKMLFASWSPSTKLKRFCVQMRAASTREGD